jgi:hypothetical protein
MPSFESVILAFQFIVTAKSLSILLPYARLILTMTSKPPSPWTMWPECHDQLMAELENVDLRYQFQPRDRQNFTRFYETYIMGKFECETTNCSSKGWSSKKVFIVIRQYPSNKYNAKVYTQRCLGCKKRGRITIDTGSYVDRVAYRLKKWNGIESDTMHISFQRTNGPHVQELCEGCRAGRCEAGGVPSIELTMASLSIA